METAKTQLRATVAPSESSTGESTAINEELQMTNEEIPPTTEALEASGDELTSMIEKLTAENRELKNKVDQLAHAHSDLQNLMSATGVATLFLDHELRITRYTLPAMELFNLVPGDLGRPLTNFACRLEYPELAADARQVLAHLTSVEREVRAGERCYLARVIPYHTADDRNNGVIITFLDITVRKVAEEALRDSEKRHRLLAETMLNGVVHQDAAGRIIAMNPAAEKILGKTREEFIGSTSQKEEHDTVREDGSIFPGEEHPSLVALRTGKEVRGVVMGVFNPRMQERRWIKIDAVPVPGEDDGKPAEVYAVFEDITEKRRQEEALQQSEATTRAAYRRLEGVLGSITDGLAVLDKDWRYIYFSEQAARIIGIAREDLLGGCLWDLFPAVEGTKFHEGFHRAVATGQKVEFEEYYPEPINKWLECHCYPSAEGLSVYFHDVTARKQAEDTLRQNEALFSTLIEQAPMGVYVVDAQFRFQQVNSLAQPVFAGVRPLVGRDFNEVMEILWGKEVGAQCSRIFRHTLDTGERFISPAFFNPRADLGVEQAYDWETQRITLPSGLHGVVCYFVDVTERRRIDAALREAKEAAETANQSKDRFLAVLSHELRTPLTPVLMVASALEQDLDLRPEIREDIAMIKRNVELETKLIDDLLDLSRITSGKVELKKENVDLNSTVRQVCEMCRNQVDDEQVRLEVELHRDAGVISADSARLQQVLWNVIKNAIKFTPAHGTVLVSTARVDFDRCEVRVKDSGIGIPSDMLTRIFNAFEQGDARITRQFGGLGLGLAISRALVELHGGSIRAESMGQGLGSTFIVELPGTAPAPVTAAPPAISTLPDVAAIRLLLVEDHADTARILARMLQGRGFNVLAVGDVASALNAVERENFDVVITDLGLPDGDGYEVLRAIRARRVVPGIAMSGFGREEDMLRSAEAGFNEHLVKPVSIAKLVDAIRRVTAHPGKTDSTS